MKRRENMMLQKGVTMYLSEAQFKKQQEEAKKKASQNTGGNKNNYGGGGGIWIPFVDGGKAGSIGPSFTDVDWRKCTLGQS